MSRKTQSKISDSENPTFDLFRLSKSKREIDVCPNTLRAWAKQGLQIYYCGKAAFVSRSETAQFIRSRSA